MKKFKRTIIFNVSKDQKIFFYPVVIAFCLGCIVSWLSLTYFLIGGYLANPDFDQLQKTIPFLLAATMVLMLAVIFWTFRISNRYLGPYERVINDLDDVLSGKKTGSVHTRKGDIMFEELLKRINALIEKTK